MAGSGLQFLVKAPLGADLTIVRLLRMAGGSQSWWPCKTPGHRGVAVEKNDGLSLTLADELNGFELTAGEIKVFGFGTAPINDFEVEFRVKSLGGPEGIDGQVTAFGSDWNAMRDSGAGFSWDFLTNVHNADVYFIIAS
jgi:hypothetical protein